MIIGEHELISDGITVCIRAFTEVSGERLTSRMTNGWLAIPIEAIVDLSEQIIDQGYKSIYCSSNINN